MELRTHVAVQCTHTAVQCTPAPNCPLPQAAAAMTGGARGASAHLTCQAACFKTVGPSC